MTIDINTRIHNGTKRICYSTDTGMLVDTKNLFKAFLDDFNEMKDKFNVNYYPFFLEMLEYIEKKLRELGLGPIKFFFTSDFYIYLLPEPEKSLKIKNFLNRDKYYKYQAR